MYKPLLYYVVGSPSEDDSTRSGPTFASVGSNLFLKGLGGVAPVYGCQPEPVYLLWENFFGKCSQHECSIFDGDYPIWPGPAEAEFSGSGLIHVWNMSTALPIVNNFSFRPWCRSTKAHQAMDPRFAESEQLL